MIIFTGLHAETRSTAKSTICTATLLILLIVSLSACSTDCPEGGDNDSFFCSGMGSIEDQDDDNGSDDLPDDNEDDDDDDDDDNKDDNNCIANASREDTFPLCSDTLDNDCNDLTDGDDPNCMPFYEDHDRDGWCPAGRDLDSDGNCTGTGESLPPTEGDCNDNEFWQNPGLPEICFDDLDNDCDPTTPDQGHESSCEDAKNNNCYARYRDRGDKQDFYLMCITHVSWWDAKQTCDRAGLSLTRVDDGDENSWIWHTYHDIVEGESPRGYMNTQSFYATAKTFAEPQTSLQLIVAYTNNDDRRWNKGSYWIGAYDNDPWKHPHRDWVTEAGHTISSTSLPYTNWASGEPNDKHERCAEVYHSKSSHENKLWNDKECEERLKFICERF